VVHRVQWNLRYCPSGRWGMISSSHWGSGILRCGEPVLKLVYSCGTDYRIGQTVPLSDNSNREKVFSLSAVGGCLAGETSLVSSYSLVAKASYSARVVWPSLLRPLLNLNIWIISPLVLRPLKEDNPKMERRSLYLRLQILGTSLSVWLFLIKRIFFLIFNFNYIFITTFCIESIVKPNIEK